MINDDDLVGRIRQARPVLPSRGDPLTDREKEILQEIISGVRMLTPHAIRRPLIRPRKREQLKRLVSNAGLMVSNYRANKH